MKTTTSRTALLLLAALALAGCTNNDTPEAPPTGSTSDGAEVTTPTATNTTPSPGTDILGAWANASAPQPPKSGLENLTLVVQPETTSEGDTGFVTFRIVNSNVRDVRVRDDPVRLVAVAVPDNVTTLVASEGIPYRGLAMAVAPLPLRGDEVVAFAPPPGTLTVYVGLDHMGDADGEAYALDWFGGAWTQVRRDGRGANVPLPEGAPLYFALTQAEVER